MNLCDYIERGATKAGSVAALGRVIGLERERVSKAKSHTVPLPLDATIKLADYLMEDRITVISANELATEKKPEKREFWTHLLAAPNVSYIRQMMN